jgi:pimeloyl-ACP methyl ester carboxylesterase
MPITSLPDIKLHYDVFGEGMPLLLIHGLGSSGRDWEFQVSDFARNYQVITIDLRGHGKSGKPTGPYSIPLFAADTVQFLKEINIQRTHILGISLGGMVAYQLGLDWPELVSSLTIVNSSPELVIRTIRDRLRIWQRFMIVRFLGLGKMGEVLANRFFLDPAQEEIRQVFIERWAQNDKSAYLEAMKALFSWSVVERLGDIQCPTLLVSAEFDYLPSPKDAGYLMKIPQARLVVIEGARHALPAEKPVEFNIVVAKFLREIDNRSGNVYNDY